MWLATGYWSDFGTPASVDWCEPNYVHSQWVAEWFNTCSSVPMVLMGLYGIVRAYRSGAEPRFLVAFGALLVVGLGSVAFHGTLLMTAQAADELPMIYGGLAFLYLLANRRPDVPAGRLRAWQIGLTLYAVAFTAGYGILADYFTLFIWTYGGLMTWLVIRSIAVAMSESPMHRRLVGIAAGLFVGGVGLVWMPEHVLLSCEHPAQAFHLHSIWHLAAGSGTYMGVVFAMWDRQSQLYPEQKLTLTPLPWAAPTRPAE
ncbi:MAG: dihydroceramidase [Myxococcota bacterium]|jgi:dihydroceramidase